jgi:hypothetical protein
VLSLFIPLATVADLAQVLSGMTEISSNWGMAKVKLLFKADQHKTSAAFLLLPKGPQGPQGPQGPADPPQEWLKSQIHQLKTAVHLALLGKKCNGPHYTVQQFLGLR